MATDDSSGDGDGHMDGSGDGDGGVEGDLFFYRQVHLLHSPAGVPCLCQMTQHRKMDG